MNKVKVGFFSFTEITDPGQHRAYNEWHQLDHMPEQFPIPGLALGQRWVCTPPCRRARIASDPLVDPAHYMTLYLMTEPVEATLAEFIRLGAELSDLGRFHRHRRAHLGGPFQVIKAYAAPRVLVSPEAIPARPNRGIFVVVQDIIDPAGADDFAQWVDQVHYPDMLGVDGIAGVWSFVSRGGGSGAFAHANPAGRRIAVYYLDGEPLEVVAEMGKRGAEWRAAGRMPDFSKSVRTLFAGPFETITPWKWDWFEGDSE